jgi:putative acyl-CoA dehydrogenase
VHVVEALETLGGAGYVEASGMPRLFRESPLNGIWEGSGNVISLDVLRALARDPEGLDSVLAEIGEASGAEPRLDAWLDTLRDELTEPETMELRARRIVEKLALALQASLLVRYSPPAVADAFVTSRLAGDGGRAFGTLPASVDFDAIIERHSPIAA